jgi:hypothetical protein
MKRFNWPIAIIALAFFVSENVYFGWNSYPQSDAELIADGLVCLIFALAWRVSHAETKVTVQNFDTSRCCRPSGNVWSRR